MLLSEEVEVKWNAKNKKHYVDLGYTYTKIGDSFTAKVEDLTKGNNSEIKVRCDYCGNVYVLKYYTYHNRHNKTKDCCGNPSCTGKKASDSLFKKYNVTNCRHINGVNDKIKETNLSKYGSENPFASEEIIQRIKDANLQKYGYEHPSQSPIIKESPVSVECRVKEIKELGTHHMFIAEVLGINADEKYIDEKGAFDISKCDLIAYSNGNYYSLDKKIGKFGFSVQKNKKRRKK